MLLISVCSGALLLGIANILRKHYFKDTDVDPEVMFVATMLGAGILLIFVQLVWFGTPEISIGFWWPFALTAFINIFIQYWILIAIKLEKDVSVIASLQGTTPMFTILTSWLLLQELPTIYGAIGIGLIVFGVYTLNLKGVDVNILNQKISSKFQQQFAFFCNPWIRLSSSKGARLAIVTAILASISLNFDKLAVINSSPIVFSGTVYLTIGIAFLGVLIIQGRWKNLNKRYFWPLFKVGFVVGVATVLINSGYLYGIVSYVGALKRTQIVWTTLLAGIFLREKHTILRLVSASIIIAGVIFIAL